MIDILTETGAVVVVKNKTTAIFTYTQWILSIDLKQKLLGMLQWSILSKLDII